MINVEEITLRKGDVIEIEVRTPDFIDGENNLVKGDIVTLTTLEVDVIYFFEGHPKLGVKVQGRSHGAVNIHAVNFMRRGT